MKTEYRDAYSRTELTTPEQARRQLSTMGYLRLADIPIMGSDYLMALFIIATSDKPLNLADVRDNARAGMYGRANGK